MRKLYAKAKVKQDIRLYFRTLDITFSVFWGGGEARTKQLIKVRCNRGLSEVVGDCEYHFSDIITKSNWEMDMGIQD